MIKASRMRRVLIKYTSNGRLTFLYFWRATLKRTGCPKEYDENIYVLSSVLKYMFAHTIKISIFNTRVSIFKTSCT